ncbi:hypothetical protein AB0C34_28145 [Nocardia sp. NPDC049220]
MSSAVKNLLVVDREPTRLRAEQQGRHRRYMVCTRPDPPGADNV